MTVNANTKIALILKQDSRALEEIVSISPKFEKLRNPFLRRIMAGRTSLAMASKLGGCTVEDFFQKLEALGFEIDRHAKEVEAKKKDLPQFVRHLKKEQVFELDVRPLIASGRDPLSLIMGKLNSIQAGQVLKIINGFEPTPLINMLEKRGYESFVDITANGCVEAYFYNTGVHGQPQEKTEEPLKGDWERVLERFSGKIRKTDVRQLKMPQPMLVILEELDHLPAETVLYVYHKRIPVFLLPQLAQRGFDYRIKEFAEAEVHLLIFKN
jgi:uncharacterized protein (DUF2249 family)